MQCTGGSYARDLFRDPYDSTVLDDYNVYYNYVKAIAEELVAQFGLEKVLSWRFMVMTEYGIGNDCFYWSSDDPTIDNTSVLSDPDAIKLYKDTLYDKYTERSKLVPTSQTVLCNDGNITLSGKLSGNAVVFYTIEFV